MKRLRFYIIKNSDSSINIYARDMDWWMTVNVVLSSISCSSFSRQPWHLWCHFTVLGKLTLKLYSYCDAKRLMKNGCQILNDGKEWKRWIWRKNEDDFGNLSPRTIRSTSAWWILWIILHTKSSTTSYKKICLV